MSSIKFSGQELRISSFLREASVRSATDPQLATELQQAIDRLHSLLIGRGMNDPVRHHIEIRLRNARRFLIAGEYGTCQFELDCLEKELAK